MNAIGSYREKTMLQDEATTPVTGPTPGKAIPLRPRVLLADADGASLGPFVAALESAGMTTLTESYGRAVLDRVADALPDLVILDLALPGVDGFAVARQIKQNDAVSHVPILFRADDNDPETVIRGFSMGAVDYVSRTCSPAELVARIEAHLRMAIETRTMLLALDASHRPTIGIRPDGSLLWNTPAAASLLSRIFSPWTPGDPLPESLASVLGELARRHPSPARRTLELAAGTGSTIEGGSLECVTTATMPNGAMGVTFLLRRSGEEERRLAARHNLTTREAQVLFWISRGKPNRDISEVLGISARTVNKHLEQIFSKLGVENRASAAAIAVKTSTE